MLPESFAGRAACVIAIVAILATVVSLVVPMALRARIPANESAAKAVLRTVASFEWTFRSAAVKDVDADGVGEFGTHLELSGEVPPEGADEPFEFAFVFPRSGEDYGSGYQVEIYVGQPVTDSGKDPNEEFFYATAWPISYGRSGIHTFYIDHTGVLRGSDNRGKEAPVDAGQGEHPWPEIGGTR